MLRRVLPIAWLVLASIACAAGPTSRPFEPVTYTHEVREKPPMHLHIVAVELGKGVQVGVYPAGPDPDGQGPWQTTLMSVRSVGNREGLDVAVNGDFFFAKDVRRIAGRDVRWYDGNWAQSCGPSMTDGKMWSANGQDRPLLIVDEKGKVRIGRWGGKLPESARHIVSGSTLLVQDGKVVGHSRDLAPRTAAGLNKDGTVLTLLVVDGRREQYSVGMTLDELATEMIKLGCDVAINLDGGGSSTLAMRNGPDGVLEIKNKPSDGHDFWIPISAERSVCNVLGVRVDGKRGR